MRHVHPKRLRVTRHAMWLGEEVNSEPNKLKLKKCVGSRPRVYVADESNEGGKSTLIPRHAKSMRG